MLTGTQSRFSKMMSNEVVKCEGIEISIRQYQTGGTGNRLWPASHALLRYILDTTKDLQQSTFVELGAGVGLVSIALGASKVYATDGDHQTVKNLRHNVLNNKVQSRVQVVKWDWKSQEPPLDTTSITYCVASDIVYAVAPIEDLVRTIRTILESSRGVKVLMMLTKRGDGSSMTTFLRYVCEHGLRAEKLAVDNKYTNDLDEEFVSRLALYEISTVACSS